MTKRLCNYELLGIQLLQTVLTRCNKKFHTRNKNRTKCRIHCGNGNRPNRRIR